MCADLLKLQTASDAKHYEIKKRGRIERNHLGIKLKSLDMHFCEDGPFKRWLQKIAKEETAEISLVLDNWHSIGVNLYNQLRSRSCHLNFYIHSSPISFAHSSSVIKTSLWAGLGEGESMWAQVKHREDFLLSLSQAAGLCRVMGVLRRGEKDLPVAAPNSSHHRILKNKTKRWEIREKLTEK